MPIPNDETLRMMSSMPHTLAKQLPSAAIVPCHGIAAGKPPDGDSRQYRIDLYRQYNTQYPVRKAIALPTFEAEGSTAAVAVAHSSLTHNRSGAAKDIYI